jgi:hypothetical protein
MVQHPLFSLEKKKRMIWDLLKSKKFNLIFSFLLGLGLAAVLRPACKGDQCLTLKAPPVHEVQKTTYQLGTKCFQFSVDSKECGSGKVIEAFSLSRA